MQSSSKARAKNFEFRIISTQIGNGFHDGSTDFYIAHPALFCNRDLTTRNHRPAFIFGTSFAPLLPEVNGGELP
jgi:hypothetical protein